MTQKSWSKCEIEKRNVQCEKVILGCFRLDWDLYLNSNLKPEDFSDPIYQQLFQMLIDAKGNEHVVMWRVMDLTQDYIDAFADTTFINWLINQQTYKEALEEVKATSKVRKQKTIAKQILNGLDWWRDNNFVMDQVNQFFELEDVKEEKEEDIVQQIVNEALHLTEIKRFLTWYKHLDSILWWFVPNQLITVGARPWRGKSMFAISTIANQLQKWFRIALFSLEMSEKEIIQRMYANLWDLGLWFIKWIYEWELEEEVTNRLNKAMEAYGKLSENFFIYDDLYSLPLIANKIRLLGMRKTVDIIYIDYLGLIESKAENRNLEISRITRTLKILAMQYWIPIVILAQLNRWVDEEDVPQLANLRDSWSIEQDSDVVLMLQRPNNENMKIYVRKNRNWPTWEIELETKPELMQLGDYEPPF